MKLNNIFNRRTGSLYKSNQIFLNFLLLIYLKLCYLELLFNATAWKLEKGLPFSNNFNYIITVNFAEYQGYSMACYPCLSALLSRRWCGAGGRLAAPRPPGEGMAGGRAAKEGQQGHPGRANSPSCSAHLKEFWESVMSSKNCWKLGYLVFTHRKNIYRKHGFYLSVWKDRANLELSSQISECEIMNTVYTSMYPHHLIH